MKIKNNAKQQIFSILLLLLLLVSVLSPFVGFPVEKTKAADIQITGLYRLPTPDRFTFGLENSLGHNINGTFWLWGGENSSSTKQNDLWKWTKGSAPVRLNANFGTAGSAAHAVYDSKRERIYWYGGYVASGNYVNQTLYLNVTDATDNGTLSIDGMFATYGTMGAYSPTQDAVYFLASQYHVGAHITNLYKHTPANNTMWEIQNYTDIDGCDLGIFLANGVSAYVPDQDAIYILGCRKAIPHSRYIFKIDCATNTVTRLDELCLNEYGDRGDAGYYCPDDGLIYVFGGYNSNSTAYTNLVWTFDPATYDTNNLTQNRSISLFYSLDDFQAGYDEANHTGYLMRTDNTNGQDIADQLYIDQINYSLAPTNNYPSPSNGAVDQVLNPTTGVKVIDNDGNTMNTTWWSNSSGAWLKFGTNTSIANNTWINQTTSNFSSYSTTYYWSANTTDGHSGWDNDTYSFTTENAPASDNPPTQSSESPSNETTGEGFNPHLQITVNDPDGNDMNVTFLTNASGGAWGTIATNSSVGNGTYSQTNSSMDVYGTTFFWKVMLQDGHGNWVNETYEFTTKANTAPAVSSPSPADGATGVSISTTELSVTINDADGGTFTWNITAPGLGYDEQTESNGSKSCTVSGLASNITYYWYVNVTDGNDTANESYSFTIGSAVAGAPQNITLSSPNPADGEHTIRLTRSKISVTISDPNGDAIDWTIQSSLGSNSADSDTNGTKQALISGLELNTTYTWYTNATDGTNWTNATWTFTTKEWSASTFDFTDFTDDIINWFLDPYKTYIGEFVWPLLFLSVIGFVYVGTKNLGATVAAIFLTFGIFGTTEAFLNAPEFNLIFSIIAVLGFAATFLALYINRRS